MFYGSVMYGNAMQASFLQKGKDHCEISKRPNIITKQVNKIVKQESTVTALPNLITPNGDLFEKKENCPC